MLAPGTDLIPDLSAEGLSPGEIYRVPSDPSEYLAAGQRALVLSTCPPGSTIRAMRFAPQFIEKGPALVVVTLPDGGEQTVVVKRSRSPHGVLIEAQLFPVLARLGLPVPALLAGPAFDPDDPQ